MSTKFDNVIKGLREKGIIQKVFEDDVEKGVMEELVKKHKGSYVFANYLFANFVKERPLRKHIPYEHHQYMMECEADFAVFDSDGFPEKVYYNSDEKFGSQIKKRICEVAGIESEGISLQAKAQNKPKTVIRARKARLK